MLNSDTSCSVVHIIHVVSHLIKELVFSSVLINIIKTIFNTLDLVLV